MNSSNISRIFFLAALVIAAVLTACPPADSSGVYSGTKSKGNSIPGPRFKNLGINVDEKKIIVSFNTKISGTPDASKITVKNGDTILKLTTGYTLTIEKGSLVIKLLKIAPKTGDKYTVELQAGAVKDANGKTNSANTTSKDKTLTVGIIPAIKKGSLAFRANSNKVLTLAFNTNMKIVDNSKIKVEVKAEGDKIFSNTPVGSFRMNTGNFLELTLVTPAIHNNVYRVKVGLKALRSTASNLSNTTELSSSEFTYSTRPILNTANPPYILNNTLVATFNLPIALKDWTKVKVYKNPAENSDGEEINLKQGDIAVNSTSKNLLEITLPTVAENEIYHLKLDAGAVREEGETANENETIEPKDRDITIDPAPTLAPDKAPYLSGEKIIVPFDGPIRILEPNKIKYQLDGTTITPITTPTVENNNQLEITLDETPAAGQLYRIELDAGALGGGKNTVSMGAIQPDDKDITVWDITAVKPVFTSNTEFSATFPTNMEIIDASKIQVEVRAASEVTFASTPVSSSRVDTTKRNLLELTLSTAAADDNVYRVKVGAGTLRATANQSINTTELTSSETIYFTGPILDRDNPPYILNNKLVANFNLPITLKEWGNVKVYKNPAGNSDGEEISLTEPSIAVNSNNLLEITLPDAVATSEVYRLRLEAGAVNEEGMKAHKNKAISPKDLDIIIKAAPTLDPDVAPWLSGQKIIVTFDGPIRILNPDEIKYRFEASSGAGFIVAIKPDNEPKVISDNQLEIPLNALPTGGQVYRIDLEAGALGGGKNQPSTGAIRPEDKDITVIEPTLTNVKPVIASKTQLIVTFPVAVAIVGDGSGINVHKKDEGDSFTTLTAEQRTIAVDDTDSKKINITLTDSKETTLYEVWKVVFPQNTVQTETRNISNSRLLTTDESDNTRLTDLYSWKEVLTSGESKWKARSDHTSVVFKDKIWVMGGDDGRKFLNDVWSSPDGKTWTESTPPKNAKKETARPDANWWMARYSHTSVVFKDKIWVMGGYEGRKFLNDVWSSPDGSIWTESTPPKNAEKETARPDANWWTARFKHSSVMFNKKIWIMGGWSTEISSDIWSSTDGSIWVEENPRANVGGGSIYKHASAVFDNKIWMIGGNYMIGDNGKSVWSSNNGRDWNKYADLPNSVSESRALEYNSRLWSIGGGGTTKSFWSSSNPATSWTVENTLPSYITRTQAVIFKKRIWLLGGRYGGTKTNKVWEMGPGPS